MDDLDFIVQETKDWKTDFSELLASAGHSTVAFVRDFNEELARFSIFTGKSKDTLKKAIGNQTSHKHIRNAVSWPQAFTKSEINNFTLQYISELIETLSFIFQTANLPKTKFIDSFLDRRGNILLRNLYPKSKLKEYIEGELTKDNFLFLTYQLGQLPESLSVVNEICNSFRRNMSFYNACAKFYTQQNAASLKKSLQKIELRPYQREAVKAIWEFFGKKRREMGIIRLPTGAGKTIVAHEIADRFLRENKNNVVIWVSKNWEILTQTAYSWAEGWGNIEWVRRIGGNPLSLGGIEEGNEGKIFFTTLHSFQSRLSKQQLPEPITDKKNVLVIYDECHWAVSATFGETLLNYFLPDSGDFAKVMGLSATPEKAFLLGDCKTNLIIQKSWKEISEYLATPEVEFLDTNIVWEPLIDKYFNTINYQSFKELSLNGARNEMIIQWINQGLEAGKYTKVVLFAIDIDHARTLAELLGQKNISADLIHTGLIGNRNQTISKFRKGQTQVLVNVEMFTHGMNVPEVDTIVMARPTDSEALCAQMIGRGARLTDKKTRFIIVEVNDNITKHHEYLFNPSDLLEKIRPTRDRGTKRVHEYPVDPKVSLFSNRMNDLSGLQYVVGQTFGVEIEITSEDESIREHEFEEYAEEIIQLLKEKVDTYPDPLQYGKGKNITDQWRVENDSSCGWEVISPILKNEADFFELKEVCMVLTDFLNDHDYLVINHRTGLHLTLATKFSKNEKIKSFIYCLQRLERGLFTLVAPSRRYYFSGEYHYEEPNEYCQPVNMVEDIDELITDDESKRYYSVNFTHSLEDIELLEVRMHSGTSVYQKIIPWISLWMMIFNATRFRFGSPGFRGEVFEGNNVKISQSTAEWEDIFWLLKKEDIPINNKLKEILWNRRKELSTYWEKAIPNRVKSWRDYGWFDSEEIIDSP